MAIIGYAKGIPITGGTDAEVAAQIATIEGKQPKASPPQTAITTGSATTASPKINQNPINTGKPYDAGTVALGANTTIPAPVNDTSARDFLDVTGGKAVQNAAPKPVENANDVTNLQTATDFYKKLIGQEATKGDYQSQITKDVGYEQKANALNDINNEALITQKAWDDKIKEARKSAGGTLAGQQETLASLTQQRSDDLANIAIRKSVALNDVNTALSIIDTKVKAKFEPLENNIKNVEGLISAYSNDMSESQKFEAEKNLNLLKENRDQITTTYQNVLQNSVQNGAPASVQSDIDKAVQEELDKMQKDPTYSPSLAKIYGAAGKYAPDASKQLEDQYRRAQIAKTYQDIADARAKNVAPEDIQQGSKEFKIAQDLAYGNLTFAQFKSLYSYSRDVNAKTNIYEKASELNPNFSPANFELGYKIAASPKIRQQISALDNVNAVIPTLITHSDEAARTNVPLLNKYIIKGGIQVGDKRYSNFAQAQVAFADELSGALGFGSATDMSRQMGFDLTRTDLSPDQFESGIQEIVVPFIAQKRASIINQMGVYGQSVNNLSSSNQAPLGPVSPTTGTTSSGINYTIIQ